MYKFFPEQCPSCGEKLIIRHGKKDDVIKLMCENIQCSGVSLRKLQKGIMLLDIKGLGPSTIEKLQKAGLNSVIDLFDKDIFNEENLCRSPEFTRGRSLEKILDAVSAVKEIPINKAIASLQMTVPKDEGEGFHSIGNSLSEQIGRMLSGVPYSFESLSTQIREEVDGEDKSQSAILNGINLNLSKFAAAGIVVKPYEVKVIDPANFKKVEKRVYFADESNLDISNQEILEKLNWEEVELEKADFVIVTDKNLPLSVLTTAKDNSISVKTFKIIKLLYL